MWSGDGPLARRSIPSGMLGTTKDDVRVLGKDSNVRPPYNVPLSPVYPETRTSDKPPYRKSHRHGALEG